VSSDATIRAGLHPAQMTNAALTLRGMGNEMKTPSVVLLLLAVAVTGCITAPDRGFGDRGWGGGDRNQSHDERDQHRNSHGDHDQH
jgi:hypothetical protein